MAASIKILFYGIDGIGLGHLSRLLAIAREARELTSALDLQDDFQLITTSEASDIAWDFPVFKIPSKTVVGASESPKRDFVIAGKLLVSNVIASFRPDILVLDTVPEGAFQEFVFLRDYARNTVFIDRLKASKVVEDKMYQSHLALYDLILVPDNEEAADLYPLPPRIRGHRRFVGRVHSFRPHKALHRDEVRAYFAVPDDNTLIYVSAGGGGDPAAHLELEVLVNTLREEPTHHLIVGYGPLYRGRKMYHKNVIPIVEPDAWRFFLGVDLAVSAAGYNTYEELLAARVPSVFFAQSKGLDQQEQRLVEGVGAGWHGYLSALEPSLIRAQIHSLKEPSRRLSIMDALDQRGDPRGALKAATELLNLHSSLSHSPVDRRQLFLVAVAYDSWQGEDMDVSFTESIAQTMLWQRVTGGRLAREEFRDAAIQAWQDEGQNEWGDEISRLLEWGRLLASWKQQLGWEDDTWRHFLKVFCREALCETERSRQRLLQDIMDKLLDRFGAVRASYMLRDVFTQGKRHNLLQRLMALVGHAGLEDVEQ